MTNSSKSSIIDVERLKKPEGFWIDDSEPDIWDEMSMFEDGIRNQIVIRFFTFKEEWFGDHYICVLKVLKMRDGRIIGDLYYTDGIFGSAFTQDEVNKFWPTLSELCPIVREIEFLYGIYDPSKDSGRWTYTIPKLSDVS